MAELLQWWNLIYVLAFFLALLYALLNAVGLASSGADADHDVGDLAVDHDLGFEHDVGLDHDVEAHVDLDHDVEAHVEVGHDIEGDVEADHDIGAAEHVPDFHVDRDVALGHAAHAAMHGPSVLNEALSFFGVGKVPLSIVLMTFLVTFAVVGWMVNTLLKGVLFTPVLFFPVSCAAAVFCGLSSTKLLASTLGKYLRPIESAATRRSALVGRIAEASLLITESFGQALVRDEYGTLHKVVCRVPRGAETVPKGQTVLLLRYVEVEERGRRTSGYYLVEPYKTPGL